MPDENGRVLPFAGLTQHDETTGEELLPDAWGHGSSMRWWAAEQRGASPNDDSFEDRELPGEGFNTIIDQLPRASTAEAGWKNPLTGEWVTTSKHNAVVDPEKVDALRAVGEVFGTVEAARDWLNDAEPSHRANLVESLGMEPPVDDDTLVQNLPIGDDALYYIPTDSYTIINPSTSLRPLAQVLRDEGLGDKVFGEFRLQRGGGRVSADILFDGKHVELPGDDPDRAPVCTGLEISYDFFGDTAFRARGLGMDFDCTNALRGITDWELVKHSGDVDDRVDWEQFYLDLLEEIDLLTDQLSMMIHEAEQLEFDLSDLPNDFAGPDHDSLLHAFFDYAGFPDYLAEAAAANVRAEADDPFQPNWWELHRGATYAITHEGRGEVMGGGAIDRYNRVANDMLMQPDQFEEVVNQNYEAAVEDREGETLAAEGGGQADIAKAFESTREKKAEFEERAEQMKELRAQTQD